MRLTKIARKFGVRPVSVLILCIGLVYLFLAYGYFEQSTVSHQRAATQAADQQSFNLLLTDLNHSVAAKRALMPTLAALPSLQSAIASGDETLINEWQTALSSTLADDASLCVMTEVPSSIEASACIPLNFATLATLRSLNDQEMSDLAIMQPKSPDGKILIAHRIAGVPAFPDASLVMTWPKTWLKQQLPSVGQVYVEISQGQEGGALLAAKGDQALKQKEKTQSKAIAGSLWTVTAWSQAQPADDTLMIFAALSALILILTWWMNRVWLGHVFEADAKVLKEQLHDLEDNKLKPTYPIMARTLKSVSALINQLVLPHKVAPHVKAMEIPAVQVEEEQQPHVEIETHSELTPIPEVEELPAVEQEPAITPESESIIEEALVTASESAIEPLDPVEPEPKPEATSLSEAELAFDAPPEPATDTVLEFDSPSIDVTPPVPPSEPIAPVVDEPEKAEPGMPDPAIFRKYDIRGKVGSQLNSQVMELLGKAVASEAVEQGFKKLVMGRDGRSTSDKFAEAFCRGALMAGCDVIDLDMVPTPMMYFACEHLETQTGVMITGSHNPVDCNGLKVVIGGRTLLGDEVQALYERIKNNNFTSGHGQLSKEVLTNSYLDRIKDDVKAARSLKVVVDCGNGAAGVIAPEVFRAIGCDVIELYCDVDGQFPNHHPDPGQPENLQDLIAAVKQHGADLGFAFDGDGDRLGVVDGQGTIIWPDQLLILMAQELLAKEPGATIVYDVKCTHLLSKIISRSGGKPIMTGSGHSVIKDAMHQHDAMLGGEMTGHFFYADRWYGFDDALYSGARLLELLTADPLERSPTDIFDALPKRVGTPEIIVDMQEGESHPFVEQLIQHANFEDGIVTTIDGLRVDFKQGWGLVRASNTVPGLTLRFEAVDEDALNMIKQQFIAQMLQVKPSLTLMI